MVDARTQSLYFNWISHLIVLPPDRWLLLVPCLCQCIRVPCRTDEYTTVATRANRSMFCLFTIDRDPARPLFDKTKKKTTAHSDGCSTAVVAHAPHHTPNWYECKIPNRLLLFPQKRYFCDSESNTRQIFCIDSYYRSLQWSIRASLTITNTYASAWHTWIICIVNWAVIAFFYCSTTMKQMKERNNNNIEKNNI